MHHLVIIIIIINRPIIQSCRHEKWAKQKVLLLFCYTCTDFSGAIMKTLQRHFTQS